MKKIIFLVVALLLLWPVYIAFQEMFAVGKAEDETAESYDACLENPDSPKCNAFIDGNTTESAE